MITFKLEDGFLEDIDLAVKIENYHSRTEFIRAALREKLEEINLKKAMIELSSLKGKAKKKVSSEEYETARKKAVEMLEKAV